jgi:hypothetical protein
MRNCQRWIPNKINNCLLSDMDRKQIVINKNIVEAINEIRDTSAWIFSSSFFWELLIVIMATWYKKKDTRVFTLSSIFLLESWGVFFNDFLWCKTIIKVFLFYMN